MNSLFATWHCDDEKKKQKAIFCRSRAYALLMKAKELGQNTSGHKGEKEAIMIDILRRIGKFKEAQSLCLETIKNKTNKLIRDIINIQLMLIFKIVTLLKESPVKNNQRFI
ncbi:MAG: hypothetical protein DDT23_01303 [candidate division WS2 bacterium]|nr:hypothetical protein [Candidatus Lithacetigena glycinireducens]